MSLHCNSCWIFFQRINVTDKTATATVIRDFVIPESAASAYKYMQIMPGGPHTPEFLVSHWCGTAFKHDVLCIAQHATNLHDEELHKFVSSNFMHGAVKEVRKSF